MLRLLDSVTQGFTVMVVLGALGFVALVASVAIFGPQFEHLLQHGLIH